MTYKLIDAAQARWQAVNAPHLVAQVRAGSRLPRRANYWNAPPTSPHRHRSDGYQQRGTKVA